jgi:uncharacterized membrane protein
MEHCSVIFRILSTIPCLGVFYTDCSDHKTLSFYGAEGLVIIFSKTWHYILSMPDEPSQNPHAYIYEGFIVGIIVPVFTDT